MYSGRFAAISSGGGINETSVSSATIQSSNKTYYGTPYRYYATVGGDVNIVLGKDGAQDGTCQLTMRSESLAGSLYSVIQGSVNVKINDGTKFGYETENASKDHDFYGMGYNDIVEGSVNITMNGGEINGELFGLGVTVGNSDGCHKIGRTDDPKEESYYYPKDALTITLNGGKVDNIVWFYNIRNSLQSKHIPHIYGNVIININGGEVGCVYFGNPEKASPVDVTGYQLPYVNGTMGMELHITGGTFTNVNQSVWAHSLTSVYKGQRIYFENDAPLSLYRIYNAKSNNNGDQADIIVDNTAPVQLKNYRYTSSSYIGNYRGVFYDCGDLDIQSGTLILPGQNKILGDFHIGENAKLVTNGVISGTNENGFLNVGGKSTGAGDLLVVQSTSLSNGKGWLNCESMTPQLPNVGEVYLRSSTTGETVPSGSDATLLDLANTPAQGRYVEYTTESAATTSSYKHAWRIAQGQVQEVTWYYEVYYQNPDGTFIKWKNAQGGKAEENAIVQISRDKFDGEDLGWGEVLGTHYIFDEDNPNNRLSATAGTATQANPLKIYYKCRPHTLSYEYDTTAPVDASLPPEEKNHYYSEENIQPVQPAVVSGYTFNGWQVKSPNGLTLDEDGTFTMPNEDVVLIGSWTKDAPAETITIQPANVTIYMGGDGYEGTVNEDGQLITDSEQIKKNGFPEPGFLLTLPESLKNLETGNLYLQYKDENNTYQWKFEKYGEGDHNVYRIVPDGNTEKRPVRMQFVKNAGTDKEVIMDSDNIDVAKYINETLTMKVYGEGIESDKVHFVYDTNGDDTLESTEPIYNVSVENGQLTVRGTTSAVQTAPVNKEEFFTATKNQPGITAPEGTTYTINGSDVKVKDTTGISLLFDNIIDSNAGNENATYTDLLKAKVDETLGSADENRQYEYKYLDLVDTHNGNAWVAANEAVTVYWPLPEGAEADADFTLLHFQDLHRSMSPTEITNKLTDNAYTPEKIQGTVEDDHIVFNVQPYNNGSGGFSPFVLVWDEKDEPTDPVDPPDGGGGTTPTPPDLNTEDHFSYVVGYEDGMVKPENAITRAEVASIFYRLLKDEVRDENTTDVSEFSDVSASDWYGTTVATLSAMDIVRGYEDGTFRPNAPITRAEFAAIATRFFEETGAEYEPGTFDDVSGNEWFANAIADAVELGLIGGYPDGTVRPNNNITRAEACAVVNRTLGRIPHVDHLLPADEMTTWPDNNPSDWFYADMQEATNGHEYEWTKEDGQKVEEWTKILDKDWEDR